MGIANTSINSDDSRLICTNPKPQPARAVYLDTATSSVEDLPLVSQPGGPHDDGNEPQRLVEANMAKSAEYSKRQEGNTTVFDVTPAAAPKFGAAIGAGAFGSLLGLGMIASGGIFLIALGGFSIWYGLKRDIRPKGYKEPATFKVTATTIEAGGRTFKTEDIHRLLIRNGITDQEIPFNGTMEVTAAQASGMAYRAKVGQLANGLTLEAGGKSTLLAGGMDGTTAYGLLSDVSKVIGFKST
jgi:hypothetical protein